MPNRILRDGILTSLRVDALSEGAELFYRRLMSVVDDYGRIEAHPVLLVSKCYPFRASKITPTHITKWLTECCGSTPMAGSDGKQLPPLITAYTVNGAQYLQINNFGQRERHSKFPSPDSADIDTAVGCQTAVISARSQDGGDVTDDGPPSDDRQTTASGDVTTVRRPTAHARASNSNSYSPPPSNVSSEVLNIETGAALVLAEAMPEQLQEILGMFVSLGRGVSFKDQQICENRWKGYTIQQRLKAYKCAAESFPEWETRPTGKIPYPVNWFSDDHWERHTPRLIPQQAEKTKAMTASDEAKRRFREAGRC